jgi:hypothetical protein
MPLPQIPFAESVAWIAPRLGQLDDAVENFRRKANEGAVVKVYLYQDELKNILEESPERTEYLLIPDCSPESAKQMIDMATRFCRETIDKIYPAKVKYS